uniref:G-patch domain-containing protein n=1 Tax=Caenorhabditis japonica TaxID=281687 RepID=A0A8R1E0V3_CAEJA
MNRKKLATYGQEFEEDDEDATSISKKPTPIHEEIATDERGKRRFHGAFTGGFSAGYWNTVGSKHGWVPQVFSSSRDARGDKVKQKAEDFMDAEDLGEYGIGNRSIKQTSTFGDSGAGQKRKMAWERESVNTVAQLFEDVVKPVSNSIGVRMLRSMGWREGRGIGLANVKQKQQRGGASAEAQFDREQAAKVAPSHEFANEDVLVQQLTPLTGSHGIGYQGLRQTTVLDESYGRTALALKSGKKNSKGIKGQAFGVGAFEEEDESVYSNYDLSQFDFSLDVSGASEATDLKTQRVDTAFEMQEVRLNPRKFYAAPRVPSNFRAQHRPIPMDVSKLPQLMKEDVQQMTAVQRAKFLGEDRQRTLEDGKEKGKKPQERRSRWDIKANEVEKTERDYCSKVRPR